MSQATSAATEADVEYVDAEAIAVASPSPIARFGAELLGTFMLVLVVLATAMYGAFIGNAGTLANALAAGLVLMAAVAAFGHVSGGHFNPAVTLGAAIGGRTRWADVLPYWVAQIIGASLAAVLLFATVPQASAAQAKSGGLPKDWAQQLFQSAANGYGSHTPLYTATSGALHVPLLSALLIETVATALFVGVILAVTGRRANRRIAPIAIGLALTALLLVAGPFTGGSLNPARSFAAALFGGSWTWGQLWVFLVGPLVGAAIAALFYRAISPAPAQDDLLGEDDVYEVDEEAVIVPENEEEDLAGAETQRPRAAYGPASIPGLDSADDAESAPEATEAAPTEDGSDEGGSDEGGSDEDGSDEDAGTKQPGSKDSDEGSADPKV